MARPTPQPQPLGRFDFEARRCVFASPLPFEIAIGPYEGRMRSRFEQEPSRPMTEAPSITTARGRQHGVGADHHVREANAVALPESTARRAIAQQKV